MKTKHVLGPWSVFDDGGETYGIIRYADGTPISTQDGCSMNGEVFICDLAIKNEANAALIAAAPDLLEALILAEAQIESFYTATMTNAKSRDENRALKKLALENVRAAIAKAGGRHE